MSLAEADLLRYSRQILVPEIGGVGQERLRACPVVLVGQGAGQRVAAEYLAAGGTEVCTSSDWPQRAERLSFDPGCLGEVPSSFFGSAPWVALGWFGNRGEVLYRSAAGCARCFQENLELLSPVHLGTNPVLLGTLAALTYQRLCLGLSSDLGRLTIPPGGEISSPDARRCLQCLRR
jgi:hypothetical protein